MTSRSKNRNLYECTTDSGQRITVFFFASPGTKALVISASLAVIFCKNQRGDWRCDKATLNDSWGPVVREVYEVYLSDIIEGDDDE